MNFIYILFLVGIVVEAMSGALSAGRKHMDFFGVILIATVAGLGGGTLRDILIGNYPLLWIKEPTYLLYTISAAIVTIFAANYIKKGYMLFLVLDALGLAAFSIVATERGLDLGLHPAIIVVIAMTTGIGGGMLRDILCNDIPLVFRKELYAVVAILGSIIYQIINLLHINFLLTEILTLFFTFGLRLAAIRWHWKLPNFEYYHED